MVKVNDIVRFLNDVGGGRVSRIDGKTVYKQTPEEFADGAMTLIDEGAKFIGGCCGTNPAFIAELRRRIDAR